MTLYSQSRGPLGGQVRTSKGKLEDNALEAYQKVNNLLHTFYICICAEKKLTIVVSLCYVMHICDCVKVGEALGRGEYSSVWLNQTFLLSTTMMSDDE